MNTLCHYSIARFMPHVETEEFANVGVVLYAPAHRYFGFELLHRQSERLAHFFAGVDASSFERTMHDLRSELSRQAPAFEQASAQTGAALWQELIKPKSSQIRFSAERVVLTDAPATQLQALYERYVNAHRAQALPGAIAS
ncbi:DUF3037 domain-containing protein [Vandammella animalimorsus]|nr:DUF3037 domain-containing protein [Vandammella animalimorsus]